MEVLAALALTVVAWLLYQGYRLKRDARNYKRNAKLLRERSAEIDRDLDTNCSLCGKNVRRVPQMYHVGSKLMCLKCLQTVKGEGWEALSKVLGVRLVRLRTVHLRATPEAFEESDQ